MNARAVGYVRSFALAAAAIVPTTYQAHAIECDQGYQRVQGNMIATPYCQDAYLAVVARQFGVNASAEKIRNNPSYKREVCRIAGRDIRVQSTCIDSGVDGRGGRF
jgi:hypothetical protein